PTGTMMGARWSLKDMTVSAASWPVPGGVFDRDNVYVVDVSPPPRPLFAIRRDDARLTVLANVVNVPWYWPYRGALYFVNAYSDQETCVERVPLGSGDPLTLLPHVPLDKDYG